MTAIGPHFAEELQAAGLFGLPFSWDEEGTITGMDRLTSEQQTTLLAVIAAHNSATPASPGPSHLNNGGLARFSGIAPVVVYENIRLGSVTRVSKGRWRTNLIDPIPEGYSPIPSYIDAAVRNVRVSACTATYVEVKAVDAAGAAADCQQIIVKIERVVS